ncbi:nuclear transport factor 2 family protein [Brucepastera parasyntrophica]|uniref:nuclear transport factor 2 family protein n=1 Tax=Brucepastera parasyntrophica TaxID=2880008 RepID=UPI00210AEECA|nr:nuclear transport factor 2 family protein [Brucepastera parasyntrophica]ULQ58499.1 nuclear transport factor 2 family protein [Brucepastera parasyntrophica]
MNTKSNPLEGRIADLVFDNGYHYRSEYLPGNRLKWTDMNPKSPGDSETETVHVYQQEDGIFTVSWIESTGAAVTHSININEGHVQGFRSADKLSACGGREACFFSGTYTLIHADGNPDKVPLTNLQIVTDFWEGFFNRHDIGYADKYLAAPYTQHNPGVADGVEAFKERFAPMFRNEYREFTAEIVRSASSGDLVYLHNHKRPHPGDPGNAGMDIFRVAGGKIVEHWDIIQPVPAQAANAHPMF